MPFILRREIQNEETDAMLEGELFGAYEPLPLAEGKHYKHSAPPKFFILPKPRPKKISLRFKTDDDSQPGRLTDNLLIYEIPGLVFSEQFRALLEREGITNIQYFDLKIEDHMEGKTHTHYKVANLLDLVDCIDKEASELIFDDDEPELIDEVDKLVLDETKIPDEVHLFRAKFLPDLVLVSDYLKELIETEDLTGFVFMAPEEYIL